MKGISTSNTPLCVYADFYGAGYLGYGSGYNSATDTCSDCKAGCATCIIDYDICYSCAAGWDFDAANYQCIRASLGLAAVVLALSVLVLIVGIITCVLAYKLSWYRISFISFTFLQFKKFNFFKIR